MDESHSWDEWSFFHCEWQNGFSNVSGIMFVNYVRLKSSYISQGHLVWCLCVWIVWVCACRQIKCHIFERFFFVLFSFMNCGQFEVKRDFFSWISLYSYLKGIDVTLATLSRDGICQRQLADSGLMWPRTYVNSAMLTFWPGQETLQWETAAPDSQTPVSCPCTTPKSVTELHRVLTSRANHQWAHLTGVFQLQEELGNSASDSFCWEVFQN